MDESEIKGPAINKEQFNMTILVLWKLGRGLSNNGTEEARNKSEMKTIAAPGNRPKITAVDFSKICILAAKQGWWWSLATVWQMENFIQLDYYSEKSKESEETILTAQL